MKKKKSFIIISLMTFVIGIILSCFNNDSNLQEKKEKNDTRIISKRTLSMMFETETGSGEYKEVFQSDWPTDGYVFNKELSKCENGGELAWDDELKAVKMIGISSDRCYVYFDMLEEPVYIDVNFASSESLTISFVNESGALVSKYDTYYYSLDDGSTYVSSSNSSNILAVSSGNIYNIKAYAESSTLGKSEVLSKKVFNGTALTFYNSGTENTVLFTNDDNYEENITYIYNKISYNEPLNKAYCYHCNLIFNNYSSNLLDVELHGSSYISSLPNSVNIIHIKHKNEDITLADHEITNVSSFTIDGYNSNIILDSSIIKNLSGTLLVNLTGSSSIYFNNVVISNCILLIKVTGESDFLSDNVSSFDDLSDSAITFLKSIYNSSSSISFDFNGFTFTLDEANSYIDSLN